MDLFIYLHDHEGISHRELALNLDDQTTLDQFKEMISSDLGIERKMQELFFSDGRKIFGFASNSTLSEIGLKHMDEVIVKHSHLGHWKVYVNEVNEFQKTRYSNLKQYMAVTAQDFYDMLHESSFFVTYPDFKSKASNLHQPIVKYLDNNTSPIMNAATHFFKLKVFDGKNPVVKFEDVDLDEGSKAAVMCKVKIGSDVFRYRIKTNHSAGHRRQVSRWNLDLIELFCYKFLERIKVGPKILFIPNCVSSECIIYIASEWIPTFRNFKGLNRSNVLQSESNRWRRALVQIYFLTVFLSLGSMHDENFGIDNNLNPIIVDFFVFNFDNPKEKFLNEYFVIVMSDATAKYHEPIVKSTDMPEDLQAEVFKVAQDALQQFKIEKDVAVYIKETFDKKHGSSWHCVVGRNFGSFVSHETNFFIYFYLNHVAIMLYKTAF